MLQASSFNVRPAGDAAQVGAIARKGRPGRIHLLASKRANSAETVTPCVACKEWAAVQQAIAGNADAQEHLFARHKDRLYRTAFSVLRNKEDAEDALQDGLCKAYTSLRSFQGRSSFSTWLTRIVINTALMTRRKNRAHPEACLDEILESKPKRLPNGLIDVRPDPEELCAATELNALVEEHSHQLSPRLRATFRLRVGRGLSARESSQVLGIPTGAVKSRFSRARQKLACALQRAS